MWDGVEALCGWDSESACRSSLHARIVVEGKKLTITGEITAV